ncbi:MAG: winged helix-turn-helix domain-containing protein [Candidatus Symbiothrix sp.]|jgi:DNA-binding response OmpR family regulator|nr:winged helix-turn-helix domain-containing protein [Candidatus Symbiothrix sp.]
MQSLRLIFKENDPVLPELIKKSLESTGKFVVLLEEENLKNESKAIKSLGSFWFNAKMRTLQWKEEDPQRITYRENEILLLLLKNAGNIVSRSFILSSFWGENSYYTSRSLDLFIHHLRKKLEKDPSVTIHTIRGEGFMLIC